MRIINKKIAIVFFMFICGILICIQFISFKLVKKITSNNIVIELKKEEYGGSSGNYIVIIYNNLKKSLKKELLLANKVNYIDIKWFKSSLLLTIDSEQYKFENFWFDKVNNKSYRIILEDLNVKNKR